MLWGKDAGGSTSKCKSNGATVVGLWVVYENGLEGYGVYGVTSSNLGCVHRGIVTRELVGIPRVVWCARLPVHADRHRPSAHGVDNIA